MPLGPHSINGAVRLDFVGTGVCHAFEVVPAGFPSDPSVFSLDLDALFVPHPHKCVSSVKREGKVKRVPYLMARNPGLFSCF